MWRFKGSYTARHQRERIKIYVSEYTRRKLGSPESDRLRYKISSGTKCEVSLLQQFSIKSDKISYRLLETLEIYYNAKRFYNPKERELQLHCYGT
jgi:hypothetical protein